ncbi:MAG: GNAT family N-acetyltransferase [Anaerolineales bacterium]
MQLDVSTDYPDAVTIETATLRDLKALRQIEKICFQDDAWPLLDLMGVLTFPNIVRLKAVSGDDLIGFIAADIRRAQNVAWIATLCVLPEFRRQGIGAGLLAGCESRLDMPHIRLTVRESNRAAIRLYEKFGYRQVDRWTKYYRDGGAALVLQKDLHLNRSS